MKSNLVIKNGKVLDGTGGDPYYADIAIKDGFINEIGDVKMSYEDELDASGMFIAPGFIDIHSHSDFTLLVDPRAVSAIHQGVTLEVVGNCGFGCFPIENKKIVTLKTSDGKTKDYLEYGYASFKINNQPQKLLILEQRFVQLIH